MGPIGFFYRCNAWNPGRAGKPGLTPTLADPYNRSDEGGRMRSLGPMELLVILGIAVLLFGGKKIPEVAKGLGEGIRNFKHALKGDEKVEEKKQA